MHSLSPNPTILCNDFQEVTLTCRLFTQKDWNAIKTKFFMMTWPPAEVWFRAVYQQLVGRWDGLSASTANTIVQAWHSLRQFLEAVPIEHLPSIRDSNEPRGRPQNDSRPGLGQQAPTARHPNSKCQPWDHSLITARQQCCSTTEQKGYGQNGPPESFSCAPNTSGAVHPEVPISVYANSVPSRRDLVEPKSAI